MTPEPGDTVKYNRIGKSHIETIRSEFDKDYWIMENNDWVCKGNVTAIIAYKDGIVRNSPLIQSYDE